MNSMSINKNINKRGGTHLIGKLIQFGREISIDETAHKILRKKIAKRGAYCRYLKQRKTLSLL